MFWGQKFNGVIEDLQSNLLDITVNLLNCASHLLLLSGRDVARC